MKCSLCSEKANNKYVDGSDWLRLQGGHCFGYQRPPELFFKLCDDHQTRFMQWFSRRYFNQFWNECYREAYETFGGSELQKITKLEKHLVYQFHVIVEDYHIQEWTQSVIENLVKRQSKGLSINICHARRCLNFEEDHGKGLCRIHLRQEQRGLLIPKKDNPSSSPIRDAVLKLFDK